MDVARCTLVTEFDEQGDLIITGNQERVPLEPTAPNLYALPVMDDLSAPIRPLSSMPLPQAPGMSTDPSGTTKAREREPSPFDANLQSSSMVGHYDAWPAEVLAVHYGGAEGLWGYTQTITVQRISYYWGTNNEPTGWAVPAVFSQPQTALAWALPFPPRHDQAGYHVAEGDYVTCLSGRDGRIYFISDELPFPAVVIKKTTSVKEVQTGGAGQDAIKVRRQAITGDPSSVPATLADLQTAAAADVEYDNVLIVAPTTQAHGYRCGDKVWVQRRGAYYFVVPGREWFMAEVVAAGPDSEADFGSTSPLYWLKEQDADIAYTGDTNVYSLSFADRTATDPSGSGGRYGRWVCARNLSETTTHSVATDGTVHVMVAIGRATASGDTEHFYVFHHAGANKAIRYGKPTAAFSSGTTVTLDPTDIAGTDNGEANVAGVYVQASQASLNLQSITLNGLTRTPDCTLATTEICQFSMADDGDWHLVGNPEFYISDWIVDAANSKIQCSVQWTWGAMKSTSSTAFDVHQGDDCDEAEDAQLFDWM